MKYKLVKQVDLVSASGDEQFESFAEHESTIRAKTFGELVKLAWTGPVKFYVGDLYHDAHWLKKHLNVPEGTEGMTFYFGIRESGTDIGTDVDLIRQHNEATYAILVSRHHERRGLWQLTIEQIEEGS